MKESIVDCYWPIIPYLFLCTIYLTSNRKWHIKKFLLYLAPMIFLLLWIHLSMKYLQEIRGETTLNSERKILQRRIREHRNVFYVLLLITIARAVTLAKVTLLIELVWICSIGILIRMQYNQLQSYQTTPFSWGMGIMITALAICINILILLQRKEDHFEEHEEGFQYQTLLSGALILGGLSVLLGLNITQLLSAPSKGAILNEVFAILLYTSTVLQMIIRHCCLSLMWAAHTLCYLLSQFAYLTLVIVVVRPQDIM